ncbi:MAG: hypothetical protein WD271_16825 [Acidimicrobiia bacterium]
MTNSRFGPRARGSNLVGVLGGDRVASVDGFGTVRPERAGWELMWWIGADDRWHFPEQEAAVRQTLLDGMPVVCTSMRVPGGDAVHRAYGGTTTAAVVEIANESPVPFVFGLVVRGASHLATEGPVVVIDGRPAIAGARAPARWALSTDGTTSQVVTGGGARNDEFTPQRSRAARLEAALLFPVAHHTVLRFVLPLGPSYSDVVIARFPDADQVARGWRAQLERGMRVELPDPSLQTVVDTARAQLLLAGQAWMPDSEVVAALEDWGNDSEARSAWSRLGMLARRKAARRAPGRGSWDDVRGRAAAGDARFLNVLRSALVGEAATTIELLHDWPAEWRGLPLDVRSAPTRLGPVSYSLRWHDERVALLWEVPAGATVRIPGFDPEWSTTEPRGETLLVPSG